MLDGAKIKGLMRDKGILNKELADAVGVSESMMTYILKGLRYPNVVTLVRMAHALGCSVDDLLTKVENSVESV